MIRGGVRGGGPWSVVMLLLLITYLYYYNSSRGGPRWSVFYDFIRFYMVCITCCMVFICFYMVLYGFYSFYNVLYGFEMVLHVFL